VLRNVVVGVRSSVVIAGGETEARITYRKSVAAEARKSGSVMDVHGVVIVVTVQLQRWGHDVFFDGRAPQPTSHVIINVAIVVFVVVNIIIVTTSTTTTIITTAFITITIIVIFLVICKNSLDFGLHPMSPVQTVAAAAAAVSTRENHNLALEFKGSEKRSCRVQAHDITHCNNDETRKNVFFLESEFTIALK
jgi:hypothetical protein